MKKTKVKKSKRYNKKLVKKTEMRKKIKYVLSKKNKKQSKRVLEKKSDKKIDRRTEINENDRKEIISLFSDAYARKVLISLGGENALEIIKSCPHCVSDEEIAKKLKVKISDVRSALNRMHGEGFVIYNRKKDSETGWYSYSWTLNKKSIFGWAEKITKEKEDLFNSESEKYYCKKCGIDSLIEFVEASNNSFKCPCCNESLEFLEGDKTEQLLSKMMPDQMKRRRIM